MMRPMHDQAAYDAQMHESTFPSVARDLAALNDFLAVVRTEHVTRAAEELGVPQPTVSRRIARLEATLGVPLFVRRGRRLETTRAGRAFAVTAERVLRDLERGVEEVVGAADARSGTVALAFLHTLGVEVVPRIVKEFRASHPGIRFQLVQEGSEAAVATLRAGEVDVCLTSPLPEGPGMTSVALHRQALCLTVPRDHPLAERDEVDLRLVAGESFIGFKRGYGLRRISDRVFGEAGFAPALAFEGEDVGTVRGLVAAGLGIALLPRQGAAAVAGVAEVRVTRPAAERVIGVCWLADRALPPPARAFRDFLLDRGADLMTEGAPA